MAQNLVISDHLGGREEVWRCLMISTILVFCIITCGAEQKGGQQGTDSEPIPRFCQHVVSGVEENDQGFNSSLQTQLKPLRKGGRRVSVSAIDLGLETISLAVTTQQGPFSASKGFGYRSLTFSPSRLSKTANNDVYFVSGRLNFFLDNVARYLSMVINFDGVFSNRTGHFCTTGCAGALLTNVDRKNTGKRQTVNDWYRWLTPAKLAYMVEHPESESVPANLVERDCEIHVELEFPRATTIETPLVTGVMASLRSPDDPSYFHPLTLTGFSALPYQYDTSVQNEAEILGKLAMPDISSGVRKNLEVWSSYLSLCAIWRSHPMSSSSRIQLYPPIWNSSCLSSEGGLCSPFHNLNISRILSSAMSIRNMGCSSDWRSVSATFEFIFTVEFANKTLTTSFLLFAEGFWASSDNQGQLVMVAHYLASDGTPLDTLIEITLQIPIVQTIHHRYGIIGHVRSVRNASDALYFPSFSFLGDIHGMLGHIYDSPPDPVDDTETCDFETFAVVYPSYIYDNTIEPKIQHVCSVAANAHKKFHRNATFPDGSRVIDLESTFSVDIPGLGKPQPYFHLENRFIGQKFYERGFRHRYQNLDSDERSTAPIPINGMIPVSFQYRYQEDLAIELEGDYNRTSGHLCMLGCRRRWEDVAAPYQDDNIWNLNASQIESCDLVFSIQYPPEDPGHWEEGSPFVTGTITSLLDAGHPLYFEPVDFNSSWTTIYRSYSTWTALRRNAETIISLATLSFATFLIAVQVWYSGRESSFKNVRYLSFVMLMILTSGHMMPLLLSFDAFSDSGFSVWPEVYEVIVRGTSMAALLLELRLLQLVWKSRISAKSSPQSSTAESPRKISDVAVLLTCLPIYATMMLVVGFVHWQIGPHRRNGSDYGYPDGQSIAGFLWGDFQAFCGVIVDLFLLPQVIANVLWDTEEKVAPLHSLFYIGMTVVRSAQHFFDAFRASNFFQEFDSSNYYYANPNGDLYSTKWDFIIPGCSVVLATLLLLQQKYGGRWFIPTSSRRQSMFLGCSRCFGSVFGHRISSQLFGFQYQNL